MKKTNTKNPENCIHIGDNYEEDIIGANNAKFYSIYISKENKNPYIENNTVIIPSFEYVLSSVLSIIYSI